MNKFELFTMIYFWLDNYYKGTTDDRILNQLSEMNPFLWKDIGSADPAVYIEFCMFLGKSANVKHFFPWYGNQFFPFTVRSFFSSR